MHVKLLAAALCASLPLVASAQSSVTIYGVADAAIAREDTGAANGSRTVVNQGNQSSSRLGFRGVEDFGNGLKAAFNLEAGYALDTGMGDAALFGRRAVVGVEGGFGSLMIGREYTPVADVANATDILGQGFYGSNLSSFGTGRLTRRISNSVNYKSNPMGGFKLGAAYSTGETSTGASGDLMGLSAAFTSGAFYVGAAAHTLERLATGDDKEMIIGAGVKFGMLDVKGNYMVANPTGANNKYEQFNIGLSYGFGPNKVFANVNRNELENGARANGASVAYTYSLSKRTNVYASYAILRNNERAVFALQSAGTAVAPPATAFGADPKALTLGVRHTF